MSEKILKTCQQGHQFYKSSNCPVCPFCANADKPTTGFLSNLSAPARRALESKGITNLTELATFKKTEIAALHGMGPNGILKLKESLANAGLSFKEK